MPGLVPGIHDWRVVRKTRMRATSAGMTQNDGLDRGYINVVLIAAYAGTLPSRTKARQPPKAEMSRAPFTASASTRKPLTLLPSDSRIVPIDSGGGTASTKRPNAAVGNAQISASMAAPRPSPTRSSPGLGG